MPRVARQHAPNVVTHVITRFANDMHVMDDVSGAREEYLSRLDAALRRSDWLLLWYCLMGTHVHLGMESGAEPLQSWMQPLNGGFATWVNRRRRKLGAKARGPIVSDRPTTVLVPDGRAGFLAAYIHNNPVRAGLAASALESDWSSHRAYVLGTGAPESLRIARGLALAGCGTEADPRAAFNAFVNACAGEARNPELSGRTLARARVDVRRRCGTDVEVATPQFGDDGSAHYPLSRGTIAHARPRVRAPIQALIDEVVAMRNVSLEELQASGRTQRVADARRLVVVACRVGRRPLREACAALGISDSAASYYLRTADRRTLDDARVLAERWAAQE